MAEVGGGVVHDGKKGSGVVYNGEIRAYNGGGVDNGAGEGAIGLGREVGGSCDGEG